jgi:hypothetical protein
VNLLRAIIGHLTDGHAEQLLAGRGEPSDLQRDKQKNAQQKKK